MAASNCFDVIGAGHAGCEAAYIAARIGAKAVRNAIEQLRDASEMMRSRELEEIVLLKLRGELSALGEITGETLTEDILSQIFSTFCIGK
jgi:tRNA modification GTPase